MTEMHLVWIVVPVLMLAWANGANDVCKGVATLLGSGAASGRHALLWGTLWTVFGGLTAVFWGAALVSAFSNGFLTSGFPVTTAFIASALTGAVAWVLLATRLGWPVSTTHALLGGIVGAALVVAGPHGLRGAAVANKALLPLLLSPLAAIVLCWCLLCLGRVVARRVPAWRPGCCDRKAWLRDPFVCADEGSPSNLTSQRIWTMLHWLSAGATSFARGLNDAPKIAALFDTGLGERAIWRGESKPRRAGNWSSDRCHGLGRHLGRSPGAGCTRPSRDRPGSRPQSGGQFRHVGPGVGGLAAGPAGVHHPRKHRLVTRHPLGRTGTTGGEGRAEIDIIRLVGYPSRCRRDRRADHGIDTFRNL